MDLKLILAGRISPKTISQICEASDREKLFSLIDDADERVAYNALWCMTHWDTAGVAWLETRRDTLIQHALREKHQGNLRLTLSLLERQTWTEGDVCSAFMDFCLKNINTNARYGIRSLAAKLAYAQCRFYPEMVSELLDRLEMMTVSDTSQALLTTRKNILKMLAKNKNTRQT